MAQRGDAELAAILRRYLTDRTEFAELRASELRVDGWVHLETEDERQIVQELIGNG